VKQLKPVHVVLLASLLVGGVARFWDLTSHSLFIDEGFTFMVSGRSWSDMFSQIVYHDFHPPLFYVVTHWLMGALHWQFWDYRYLTASCGLVTIVATWAIARRLFGDAAAMVAVVVAAVDPSLIEWDRMYRMYAVMAMLASVSWWLLLVASEARGRAAWWWWLAYGACAVVQPYVQYLGALNVLCQGLYALGDIRRRWPVLACGAVAALALLPWLPAIRIQYPNGGYVNGTSAVPIYWLGIARDSLATGMPVKWAVQPWFDPLCTAVALLLAGLGIIRGPRTILLYWLGVAALQIGLSLVTGKSLVVPRYLDQVVPAFAIAAGAAVDLGLRTRLRAVALVAAIAMPASLALGSADIVLDPYYQTTDWYLVNYVVLQDEHKSDALLFVQGFPYVVVGDFSAFRGHDAEGPAMPSDVPATLAWLRRHASQRVWYIENQFYYPDPKKKIKAYLDKTRRVLYVRSELKSNVADIVNIILYSPAVHVPTKGTRAPGVPKAANVRPVTRVRV